MDASVVLVHSWAGGRGCTQLTANLGWLLAQRGLRVGMVDLAFGSAALHLPYSLECGAGVVGLATVLLGDRELAEAVVDLTSRLPGRGHGDLLTLLPGYLVRDKEVEFALAQELDLGLVTDVIDRMIGQYALDVVVLDTQSGLNAMAMVGLLMADVHVELSAVGCRSEAECDSVFSFLRVEFEGAPEFVPVVSHLDSPGGVVLPPGDRSLSLPHSPALAERGPGGLVASSHPRDPLTRAYLQLADVVTDLVT
ncbi:MinD/ParA family ATP-binding protein [Kutzneria kofuensis]|uniref:Septum formation inhibitor-activating ATPase MinD n=1 Tax=Kutzneria kofuensis TaxID=103725 RepID=A0A7W9KQQ7_9PSEU|nr:hypothetical protein [Kutzneria kofuensis]MBB5896986.1 septum formation inhibitor-activating ATPase MinD [Kutzneria kofuensis]